MLVIHPVLHVEAGNKTGFIHVIPSYDVEAQLNHFHACSRRINTLVAARENQIHCLVKSLESTLDRVQENQTLINAGDLMPYYYNSAICCDDGYTLC